MAKKGLVMIAVKKDIHAALQKIKDHHEFNSLNETIRFLLSIRIFPSKDRDHLTREK